MRRLKYTMLAMTLLTTLVVAATLAVSGTLAMIIDQTATLVNTFVPSEISAETSVELNIHKSVVSTGEAVINPGGFVFELTDNSNGNTLITTSNANGRAVFTLSYSAEDIGHTFNYTLTECNDGREGVIYSTTSYQIQVDVSLVGNDLIAQMTVDGRAVEQFTAEFVNFFGSVDAPPPPSGDRADPFLYAIILLLSIAAMNILRRKQNVK